MSLVAKQVCHVPVKCTIILVCFSKSRTTLCFLQQLCNLQQPDMLQDRFVPWVVKSVALLFSSFAGMLQNKLHGFATCFTVTICAPYALTEMSSSGDLNFEAVSF